MADKKLVIAQFGMDNIEDFEKVISAFIKPFPSLRGMDNMATELLDFLFTGEFDENIQDVLDDASVNGEWPGRVYLTGENSGAGWETHEMIIEPYVGDRILIVRDFREGMVWPTIFCQADYSARPSAVAAQEIIALLDSKEVPQWNPPRYEE